MPAWCAPTRRRWIASISQLRMGGSSAWRPTSKRRKPERSSTPRIFWRFPAAGEWTDAGVHENALVIVIRVPVVAGKLLVVPDELAGLHVERDRRVAIEVGRRGQRHSVGAAVPRQPRIGVWVGDAPVQHLAIGIVGA